MTYRVRITDRALKDLRRLPIQDADRVLKRIERLQKGLVGDIKKLTNHEPAYRLRVGDYRVLFDLDIKSILVQRVLHRKEAYD